MANFLITSANSITQTGATPGIINSDTNNTLFIAAQGFVVQSGTADTIRFTSTAVGAFHSIVVDGTVRSTGGAALQLSATSEITIGASGHLSSQSFVGINASANVVLTNAGMITGEGALILDGDGNEIRNFGFLTSTLNDTIRFTGNPAIPAGNTVFNSGTISAANGIAISSTASAAAILLTNTGTMLGGVQSGATSASDVIENSGLIAGFISLGGGTDTYDGRGGGIVDGNIDLGTGNDTFFGGGAAESVSSSADNDTFDFGGGNDTFTAFSSDGNDTIDGGDGIDTLDFGSLGSLNFINLATGVASATGSLDTFSNFENIRASNGADQLIGNSASNRIEAFFGADLLDGRGAGTDILDGGGNNDTYIIDAGDTIIDASGIDLVQSSAISLNLSTLGGGQIENAQLLGSANLNITGNGGKNVITGNAGKNTLTGGADDDTFVFNTRLSSAKADRITDFNRIDDVMHLENTGSGLFTGLTAGALASTKFKANAAGVATDSNDRIIYDTTSGDLFFDRNGSAAGGAIKFATLTNKSVITAADFFVI